MKKWKIVLVLIPTLVVLSFVSYIVILILFPSFIIPGYTVAYHAEEELTDLYLQNKGLLNSVRKSVLSSDSLMNAMNQERDGDIGIYVKEDKQYFTEEEWTDIVSVFEKLHPYMIMLERKGGSLKFHIDFDDLKLDTGSKTTTLFWFPAEEELEFHKKYSLADSVEYTQIEEGWYIVEETYPWQ